MVTFSYVRALSVSLWEKSWLKCIILTIAYSLKSVGIVIGCISNHNNTNKHNNCLNLMRKLNGWVITVPCEAIKELVNGEQYEKILLVKQLACEIWQLITCLLIKIGFQNENDVPNKGFHFSWDIVYCIT